MKTRFPIMVMAMALALCPVCAPEAQAKDKAALKWVEHTDRKFSDKRQADGDSFAMELKRAQGKARPRTYRLYGVDCPETDAEDAVLDARIKEQAAHFGCKPEEIPALGKEAAEFTEKLLKRGKPVIHTYGKMGQKVEKSPGRPQRYYALVEVTTEDGKRRMLHELLLEAGLARAHGKSAAWPPEQEDRHGEKAAGAKFMKDLERLESAARRAKAGARRKAARQSLIAPRGRGAKAKPMRKLRAAHAHRRSQSAATFISFSLHTILSAGQLILRPAGSPPPRAPRRVC